MGRLTEKHENAKLCSAVQQDGWKFRISARAGSEEESMLTSPDCRETSDGNSGGRIDPARSHAQKNDDRQKKEAPTKVAGNDSAPPGIRLYGYEETDTSARRAMMVH